MRTVSRPSSLSTNVLAGWNDVVTTAVDSDLQLGFDFFMDIVALLDMLVCLSTATTLKDGTLTSDPSKIREIFFRKKFLQYYAPALPLYLSYSLDLSLWVSATNRRRLSEMATRQ